MQEHANLKNEVARWDTLHSRVTEGLELLDLVELDVDQELVAEGDIGGLAKHAYSFMGYQGFPPDTSAWQETYGPQVAGKLKAEEVDCVLLTPA